MADEEALAKALNSPTVRVVYEDLLQPSMRVLGKSLAGVAKITAPFGALFHLVGTKAEEFIQEVGKKVPKEKRAPANPQFVMVVLEEIRFREKGDPLREMFADLLARAIHEDHQVMAHPAFPSVLAQMSPDEAVMLVESVEIGPFSLIENRDPDVIINVPAEANDLFPIERLGHEDHALMYARRLTSLNLLEAVDLRDLPVQEWQTQGPRVRHWFQCSDFGRLFAAACAPMEGPAN